MVSIKILKRFGVCYVNHDMLCKWNKDYPRD
jgi:hypothetical protein